MLLAPDQQQNLFLLHDEPARHNHQQPAQHHRSRERLVQTSRADYTANSSASVSFDVPLRTRGCLWCACSLDCLGRNARE